jgi:hypothetical protein
MKKARAEWPLQIGQRRSTTNLLSIIIIFFFTKEQKIKNKIGLGVANPPS